MQGQGFRWVEAHQRTCHILAGRPKRTGCAPNTPLLHLIFQHPFLLVWSSLTAFRHQAGFQHPFLLPKHNPSTRVPAAAACRDAGYHAPAHLQTPSVCHPAPKQASPLLLCSYTPRCRLPCTSSFTNPLRFPPSPPTALLCCCAATRRNAGYHAPAQLNPGGAAGGHQLHQPGVSGGRGWVCVVVVVGCARARARGGVCGVGWGVGPTLVKNWLGSPRGPMRAFVWHAVACLALQQQRGRPSAQER